MTTWGYIRISSQSQNPSRQIAKMEGEGIPPENVFVDRASGKDLARPAYSQLLSRLREGDTLVIDSLDRLGRNYADVTEEWRRLVGMGVDIRCLDLSFFDSAKFRDMGAIGVCVEDMLLSLLAYVAQTEREKMLQRQREGIAIAKAQGKYKGRSPQQFPPEKIEEAREALRSHGKTAAARVLGCHRNTVYRLVEDGRL